MAHVSPNHMSELSMTERAAECREVVMKAYSLEEQSLFEDSLPKPLLEGPAVVR